MGLRALSLLGGAMAAVLVAACSLVVSTSGLSDGSGPLPGDGSDGSDGGARVDGNGDAAAPRIDAGVDATTDPTLLGAYSFEDPPGTIVLDSSGNQRHGVLGADATFVADGSHGRAMAVNGTGYFVADALSGAAFPRSGTLSFWFRYSFPQGSAVGRGIFDNYDTSRSHVFVRRASGVTGASFQAAFQSTASPGQYAASVEFDIQPSSWSHLVVTWDEVLKEGALYVDGALIGSGAYTLPFTPDGQLFRFGEGLVGGIDEVRLYSRVFTAVDAAKLD